MQKRTDFFDNSLFSTVPDIPLVIRNKPHNNQLCADLSRLISPYPVVSHFLRFAWQTTVMIVYTPLWDTMKKRGISTYALINKYNISSSTINRLRHNMGVTTQLIDDLCYILDCKVEDIMKYENNDKK